MLGVSDCQDRFGILPTDSAVQLYPGEQIAEIGHAHEESHRIDATVAVDGGRTVRELRLRRREVPLRSVKIALGRGYARPRLLELRLDLAEFLGAKLELRGQGVELRLRLRRLLLARLDLGIRHPESGRGQRRAQG